MRRVARVRWGGPAGLVVVGLLAGGSQASWAFDPEQPLVAEAGRISPEEFLESPFAQLFRAGDDLHALEALDALGQTYPDDPLILRYRAIVLDRLGRHREAMALYRTLLARQPDHVPTRYFLAHAYARAGDTAAAMKEWRWVIQHSPSEAYRRWAQDQLDRFALAARAPTERKRWYLFGDVGAEYDSNPLLKPTDKGVAVAGDEKQAERFSANLALGFQMLLRPDRRVDVIWTSRQSLHDRGLDAVNFTSEELTLDARQQVGFFGTDVVMGLRYGLAAGWLDGRMFSLSHEWLVSADGRLVPQTRTVLYQRVAFTDFGPDGSNPPQTSRDGLAADTGVVQYLYSADYRRYLWFGEVFEVGQPRGANFTRRALVSRLGLHLPVPYVPRTDLDLSGSLRLARYPRFVSLSPLDPERRRDTTWELAAALTHYVTRRLALRVSYRYVNANNRNDFFQHDRHIGGLQALFTQYF